MKQTQPAVSATGTANESRFASVFQRLNALLTPRFVMSVALLLCLYDVIVIIHTLTHVSAAVVASDFYAFLHASHLLQAGKNPYDPTYWKAAYWFGTGAVHDQYAYPPLFAQFLLVLSLPGDIFAYLVWNLISVASLAGSLVLLLRHFGARIPWPWVFLTIGIVFSSGDARLEVYHGQVNWVLLGLITLGIWLYGRGRPAATGTLWAIAIAVKPFLVVLLIYLIWKRSWRAVWSCVATGGLVTFASFALTLGSGLTIIKGWLAESMYDSNLPFAARPDNFSVHGFLLRLFAANPYTLPWVNSGVLLNLINLVLVAVLVVAFVAAIPGPFSASLPTPPVANANLLAETGLVLALGLSYGPLTEGGHLYNLIPGVVGVALLTYHAWQRRHATARVWIACCILFALALFKLIIPVSLLVGEASGYTWVQTGGPGLLWTIQIGAPLLAATLLLAYLLRTERKSPSEFLPTE